MKTLQVSADLNNLAITRQFIRDAANELQADPATIGDVVLAVNEVVTNIIEHGYQGEPGIIEIEVEQATDSLIIRLRDQAPPFDPNAVPAPDLTLPLEKRPLGGLGVYITRQVMDEVTHQITPQGGNELTLVKKKVINN
jgi:serine/threonine-protein kinase RsbW